MNCFNSSIVYSIICFILTLIFNCTNIDVALNKYEKNNCKCLYNLDSQKYCNSMFN